MLLEVSNETEFFPCPTNPQPINCYEITCCIHFRNLSVLFRFTVFLGHTRSNHMSSCYPHFGGYICMTIWTYSDNIYSGVKIWDYFPRMFYFRSAQGLSGINSPQDFLYLLLFGFSVQIYYLFIFYRYDILSLVFPGSSVTN